MKILASIECIFLYYHPALYGFGFKLLRLALCADDISLPFKLIYLTKCFGEMSGGSVN